LFPQQQFLFHFYFSFFIFLFMQRNSSHLAVHDDDLFVS
jgi:hypothetical protein